MASIERRRGQPARVLVADTVVEDLTQPATRVAPHNHSETFPRLADAERRRVEIAHELTTDTWHDRHCGDETLRAWVADWLPSRHDLQATTQVRLEVTMNNQVLPRFGDTALNDITNSDVRRWVVELMASGLSAATTRKAVFALRQALESAVADQRIVHNAALAIPLPSERSKPARYLSQTEVERLAAKVPPP